MPGPYWDTQWNPVTGCTPASPGCLNCWAKRIAERHLPVTQCPECGGEGEHPYRMGDLGIEYEQCTACDGTGNVGFRPAFHPNRLDQPLHWRKPRVIFVANMGDLFHEAVTDEQRVQVFGVMARCPQHRFLVLTKRAEKQRLFTSDLGTPHYVRNATGDASAPFEWPLPNVWLGVTVCNQAEADEKIPLLLDTPAAHRWLSIEPMLGAVDLELCGAFGHYHMENDAPGTCRQFREWDGDGIDSVVLGGESGPGARPMDPTWALDVWRQCRDADVPFMFKQWGGKRLWPEINGVTFGVQREWMAMESTKQLPWEVTP